MMGASIVQEKIRAIPDFPPPLAVLVEHLILSHHGTREFGSPALPQTREAVALHFLDDMDSKMAAMRTTLDSPAGEDEWTERNPSLGRPLLRADKFQAGPDANQAVAASAPKQGQRKG
jgi:3'-5' exoribonuclease